MIDYRELPKYLDLGAQESSQTRSGNMWLDWKASIPMISPTYPVMGDEVFKKALRFAVQKYNATVEQHNRSLIHLYYLVVRMSGSVGNERCAWNGTISDGVVCS